MTESKLATKPCEACPYRKDAPKGFWAPQEFLSLVRNDHPMGATFGCHLNSARKEQDACVGWLADQKRRGVPNARLAWTIQGVPGIGVREGCVADAARFEAIDETDPNLYGSIDEMVLDNVGRSFPTRSVKAKRLVRKLERKERKVRKTEEGSDKS